MANLITRVTQLIFGKTGGTGEFGQVGSESAGSPVNTKDIGVIQSLSQYLEGLYSLTVNAAQAPFIQDFNSLFLMLTTQLAYLFQAGISEYDASTNYFNNISYVQVSGVIYQSIQGTDLSPNVGNTPASSPTFWRPLLNTDGTLAANSDLVVATQKAVKTYVDALSASTTTALATKPTAVLDTDGTLAANSDAEVASQKATKTYADTGLALKATKANPVLTGTVDLVTGGSATLKLASLAFLESNTVASYQGSFATLTSHQTQSVIVGLNLYFFVSGSGGGLATDIILEYWNGSIWQQVGVVTLSQPLLLGGKISGNSLRLNNNGTGTVTIGLLTY